MDFYTEQFSALSMIGAAMIGFVFGRMTSSWNAPRRIAARRQKAAAHPQHIRSLAAQLSAPTAHQVRALIVQNRKIEAIKLIRQELRCDLKEAKDIVDGMSQGR